MQDIKLVEEKFLSVIFRVTFNKEEKNKKKDDLFEKTFHTLLEQDRGIWEKIADDTYAIAFWDYDTKKQAETVLKTVIKQTDQGC